MQINRRQLPCDKPTFLAKLNAYLDEMKAHALTEGVPAPFPAFEIMRTIYERGGAFEIVEEVIVSAQYATADNAVVNLQVEGEGAPRALTSASDPYMWILFQEWMAAGGKPADCPPPSPAEVEAALKQAVQTMLDAKARALGYDSIFTAVTYADEPSVPKFQQEGIALRAWRSTVWAQCLSMLSNVDAGGAVPTEAQLLAALPRPNL